MNILKIRIYLLFVLRFSYFPAFLLRPNNCNTDIIWSHEGSIFITVSYVH